MDPVEELERMAFNAAQEPADEISPDEIERWQKLFSYSYEQAIELIDQHNHDYTRTRLTDSQWHMICTELENQGYDRNAWEHELAIGSNRPKKASTSIMTAQEARRLYLLKLEAPLSTLELVRLASGLIAQLECVQGEGDNEKAEFCIINGSSKQRILEWISSNAATFKPTFAPFQKANKDFSNFSNYPTLGIDSTLPQYRARDNNTLFEPGQDQYPVWYFFYGTLAQNDILSRQLGLLDQETPILHQATICHGQMETWGGRYKALIDASPNSKNLALQGSTYQVTSKEHEDALRMYETDNYEVVRCTISIKSEDGNEDLEVKGCTFRFLGTIDKI